MMPAIETGFEGVRLYPGLLSPAAQNSLYQALLTAGARRDAYRPLMPRTARPWSITQFNLGPLGWVSDASGYRYQATHPVTGLAWPAMPPMLPRLWNALTGYPAPPECCLVNLYGDPKARMGLHQDRDEAALDAPVLSLSLGDTCVFRVGGFARRDASRSFKLASGDALIMGGASRLRFHGVDRVIPGTSRLLEGGGRWNLTLRRVSLPGEQGPQPGACQ